MRKTIKSGKSRTTSPANGYDKFELTVLYRMETLRPPDPKTGCGKPFAGNGQAVYKPRLRDPFVGQLLHVLEQNFAAASFTVEQLAGEMALCSRTLHRRTISLNMLSASKIICLYRLYKAIELLQQGNLVGDIAYAVGFENLSYFTRCFKKQFKVCPSCYITSRYSTDNLTRH